MRFMPAEPGIAVQVVYALPGAQEVVELMLPPGATAGRALVMSGLLERYPEIDLRACRIGIYGRLVREDTALRDGDRVEIYRPLIADPKQARRRRASRAR